MAMTRPAVLAAVVLAASLVVALTACSPGERVDLGGESSRNLVAAIAGEPDQLDPQKTSAYFSFEVLENVFDTLVEPDANLEMRPALAQSWDVSPDQRFVIVLAFNLVGDGMRDVLDPKQRTMIEARRKQ
jgi:peptide/nickel transport system substrate-binding protein